MVLNAEQTVRVGIGIFVFDDQKRLLLLKRKGSHGEGTWCLPGGHLEFGESFEACSRREVMEESGLKIDDVQTLIATNDFFSDQKKHYVTVFTAATSKSTEARICEPEKCTEIRWCKAGELPQPLFLPLENLLKEDFHCPCGSGERFKKCHAA